MKGKKMLQDEIDEWIAAYGSEENVPLATG
jgi:hypothetical protein